MSLILATRLDGWGRMRTVLGGLLAMFVFLFALAIESNSVLWDQPPRQEFMRECYSDRERKTRTRNYYTPPPYSCGEEYERKQLARLRGVRNIAAVTALPFSVFWLFSGLVGWVFRGFSEKQVKLNGQRSRTRF